MMNISGDHEVTVRKAGLATRKPGRYLQRLVAGNWQAGVWETRKEDGEWISLTEEHPRGRKWWR